MNYQGKQITFPLSSNHCLLYNGMAKEVHEACLSKSSDLVEELVIIRPTRAHFDTDLEDAVLTCSVLSLCDQTGDTGFLYASVSQNTLKF